MKRLLRIIPAVLAFTVFVAAQGPPRQGPPAAPQAAEAGGAAERDIPLRDEPPVVTQHQIKAGARTLEYTVTTGTMPIKDDRGTIDASIFFMAYTLKTGQPAAQRPLLFSFNGGPGSSSVWLHLGALGPKRVKMLDDGGMPPPPYQLVDNEHTWLDFADLVFIDPVGTGYSRARNQQVGRRFWGLQGDVDSVGEFIRMYLTRHQRWSSPLFVSGESYGTTRAAGLAGHLVERGIAFNGVILISAVLNFQGSRWAPGNDLPPISYLPTYTATAWYHKKLPADLQKDLRKALKESEEFALGGYPQALARGDRMTAAERKQTIDKLARLTGLSVTFIDQSNLRVENSRFCKELLRDEKRTVGRLDGRFKGWDALASGERPDFDPSMAAIRPPYTATFNDYVRGALGFKTDLTYHILGGGIGGQWDFGVQNGYADVSESLRQGFAKNPYQKVFLAYGYYDFATPYFGALYTLNHMNLDVSARGNVTMADYEAGHMMYIDLPSLAKLKKDVAEFVAKSLKH